MVQLDYLIEGFGAIVNDKGEEQPPKTSDFALVNPDKKHHYRYKGNFAFMMICGVSIEFEWY